MQALPSNYLVEIAQQIAFVSAFLGGFSATFLATLIVYSSSKKSTDWSIGCSAFAASCFIVAVVGSVMLTIVLHPEAPSNVSAGASINTARVVIFIGFALGLYALLCSIGISGWIRSRRTGIMTSTCAVLGVYFVTWAILSFR
ncbi:MAG: hypothetical protein HRT54_18285 [Colwellia sp.]|nr:hypothetical protein [Colwellia sp.]